ncbi:MAG: hypothetical protein JSR82_11525 [Verrucomicrobia bacterium]|nr:hypothetical protein [Verrucomicrobiota bacterium]
MGCFLKGCLTLIVVGLVLAGVVGGGAYYYYGKFVETATSDKPAPIKTDQPSDTQFQAASNKLNGMVNAWNVGHEATIELTAADLNALVARHPSFAAWRGKVYFTINNSDLGIDTSVPLDFIKLDKLKGRYFNGRFVTFFEYLNGQMTIRPKLVEANGNQVPQAALDRMDWNEMTSELRKNKDWSSYLDRIKSIRVTANTVVITTKLNTAVPAESK